MARVTEISQIYDRKLKALRDPQKWEDTLRRTSNFWRLSFCEAMLLTEQNPNATVCGTLQQWNKCGRYVRRGEKSVAVFKDRTDTQLTYLFDISQTYGAAFNPKWVMSERIADGIVGKFNAENDEKVNSLEEFLIKDLDKNIDLVYNYDSKLTKTIENDPRVLRLISESAKCICMTRCGIDREYDFSVTEKLGSDLSIIAMGNAAAVLAREVLRDVDRTIRRKEYEQYEADVCGRHLRYPLRREGRSEISEIRELRQSADVTDSEESVRPDERNGQNGVGNDQHKRSLPDDMGGNSGESGAEQSADGGNAEKENDTQRELRSEGGAAHSDRNAVAERGLGYNTSVRELVVGGDLEQGYADGDSEYQSEYDDELIEEEYDEAESDEDSAFFVSDGEQLSFFTDEPSEDTNGLFIGEYNRLALLEEEILRGTGSVDGKFRVQKYYLNEAPSRKELAAFMKKEYGIGGHSGNGDVDFIDHDSKGIRIRVKDVLAPDGISTARFGWSEVAQFTAELIDSGEYITQAEIDERIERAKKTLKNYRPSNQFDTYQIEYAKTVLREYGFLAENESDLTESLPAEIEEKVAEIMAKYGNSDKFFVNLEPEHVTDVYYNPDSSEGGQLVYNRFDFDDIDEALLSSDPASYIDSASEVSLVDITDTEFVGYAEGFLNNSGSVSESYIFVSDSPSRIEDLRSFIDSAREFDRAIRNCRSVLLDVPHDSDRQVGIPIDNARQRSFENFRIEYDEDGNPAVVADTDDLKGVYLCSFGDSKPAEVFNYLKQNDFTIEDYGDSSEENEEPHPRESYVTEWYVCNEYGDPLSGAYPTWEEADEHMPDFDYGGADHVEGFDTYVGTTSAKPADDLPKSVDELQVGDRVRYDGEVWEISEIDGDFSVSLENADKSSITPVRSIIGHWKEHFQNDGFEYIPRDNAAAADKKASEPGEKQSASITEAAVESTEDYSNSDFHSELINTDVQNEGGSFGETREYYRIVTADGKGQLRAYDDKVYRSFDEARAAISDNEQLTEISYDDIVKKVFDERDRLKEVRHHVAPAEKTQIAEPPQNYRFPENFSYSKSLFSIF